MPLRILYNATFAKVGGALSYSLHQLSSLADRDDVEVSVLTSPWNHEAFVARCDSTTNLSVDLVKIPNVPARFLWEQSVLALKARHHDVLVCPGNFAPLVGGKPVVLILQNPNYVGRGRQLPQNAGFTRRLKIGLSHLSMRRADLVIVISNSLADEAGKEPALSGVRRVTIPSGALEIRTDPVDAGRVTKARELVGDEPFILSVANDYPHKRLADLAELARLLPSEPDLPGRIVFVGDIGPGRRTELEAMAGSESDRLTFLGAVGDRDLVAQLYREASVAVSSSELEAYPLTPQEAGSLGTRLVLTDIPPHREVTRGHASFFGVGDLQGLTSALKESLSTDGRSWSIDSPWSLHGDMLVAALHSLAA